MKKIGKFLRDFFTLNVPLKLLAMLLAALTVMFINL